MEKDICLFLDDIRTPKDTNSCKWYVVRSYDEFVAFMTEYIDKYSSVPNVISFDHDLDNEHIAFYFNNPRGTKPPYEKFKFKTGMHCLVWLNKYCESKGITLDRQIAIHSDNLACAFAMERFINGVRKELGVIRPAFQMKWEYEEIDKDSEKYKEYLKIKNNATY